MLYTQDRLSVVIRAITVTVVLVPRMRVGDVGAHGTQPSGPLLCVRVSYQAFQELELALPIVPLS